MTVFFNDTKDKKTGEDLGLDFDCVSYSVENGWVNLKLSDRIIHLPEYRIKEVQSKDKEDTIRKSDASESRSP